MAPSTTQVTSTPSPSTSTTLPTHVLRRLQTTQRPIFRVFSPARRNSFKHFLEQFGLALRLSEHGESETATSILTTLLATRAFPHLFRLKTHIHLAQSARLWKDREIHRIGAWIILREMVVGYESTRGGLVSDPAMKHCLAGHHAEILALDKAQSVNGRRLVASKDLRYESVSALVCAPRDGRDEARLAKVPEWLVAGLDRYLVEPEEERRCRRITEFFFSPRL